RRRFGIVLLPPRGCSLERRYARILFTRIDSVYKNSNCVRRLDSRSDLARHRTNPRSAKSLEMRCPASLTATINCFFLVAEQRAVGMLTLNAPQAFPCESKTGAPIITAPNTVSSSL